MNTEFLHPGKVAALAAGKHQATVLGGERKATGSVAFAGQPTANDTITINGVVFTAKASGAAGNEFNIGADLGESIDNLVTVLNGSAVAAVALATYANVTDTSMSVTFDAYGTAGNAFTLAESGSNTSVSGATLTGGTDADVLDLSAETMALVTATGGNQHFWLPVGDEGQEVTLYLKTKGGSSNAVVHGTFSASATTLTFDTAGEFAKLKSMNGVWYAITNTGEIA